MDIVGILCAISTAILYAICTIMLQIGLADIDPITANFIRIFSGSLALIPMFAAARVNGMPKPPRKAVKVIAALGIFGVVPGSIAFLAAVKYAGAVITSVLASTTPLFALPISIFVLKEKLTRLALMGIFATILGVILVVMV
jgi:DME family drug/metabolite transporter